MKGRAYAHRQPHTGEVGSTKRVTRHAQTVTEKERAHTRTHVRTHTRAHTHTHAHRGISILAAYRSWHGHRRDTHTHTPYPFTHQPTPTHTHMLTYTGGSQFRLWLPFMARPQTCYSCHGSAATQHQVSPSLQRNATADGVCGCVSPCVAGVHGDVLET